MKKIKKGLNRLKNLLINPKRYFTKIVADGAVHYDFLMNQFLRGQQIGYLIVVYIRHRNKIFFRFVFHHGRKQVVQLAGGAEKHFTLPVLHIFLDIKCNRFSNTEILHVFGYYDPKFLAQSEKVIDGIP